MCIQLYCMCLCVIHVHAFDLSILHILCLTTLYQYIELLGLT